MDTLRTHFLWPYMFDDVLNILVGCIMHSKDNPIPKSLEELKFLDKGNDPF